MRGRPGQSAPPTAAAAEVAIGAAQRVPARGEGLRVACAGICALVLTIGLARFAYTPLLPLMRAEAGLGDAASGWLATFNYLGYMSAALLAARGGDPERRHRLYRFGLLAAVLTTAAMGLTTDPVVWAVLRFVAGMSGAAGMLLASGFILNWLLRHRRPAQLGLHFSGIGLSVIVTGVAAWAMADALDWDSQWLAFGGFGLVLLLPAWAWMPAPVPLPTDATDRAAPVAATRLWLALLVLAYFAAGFGFVVSATFIVAVVEKMPGLGGLGAWIWMLIGLAAMPSTLIWDRIARRLGDVRALLLAFVLQILAIALPVIDQGLTANLLSAVLYGGTFVGIVSLTLAMAGRSVPDNPARAMARLTLSYGLAQIIAPAWAGHLAAAGAGFAGALVLAAAVMSAGLLPLVLMLVVQRRRPAGARDASPHRPRSPPSD